ncbi:glycosyl hydrolase family 28-related protein [Halalkalibacter hemicellulosilyticus]|uniref:Phage protein n=1 Tax=Halalkalibacter hemicellulosilyticusJCM 9152 TaxID=1236971 RepID=W4QBC5_9BACI|nr:NosD domain-containing protein [Halalkalibacter hemicellulosilyticus]GAE29315.1 phage protein [Halalkalibacter hemicellulosilyticusJCM 9152]
MKKLNSVLIVSVILIVGLVAGVAVTTIPLLPHSVSQYLGIANTTGYYNIIDYGAQSDRPGFDNAKVINEIIQDMGDNGGTIYIPVGNFYIHSPIAIDRSYISIIGDNSGLRSGVDGSTNTTQFGGGGAKLIVEPGVTAIQILDEENSERISGVSFKSFQLRGQGNNGIGIEAVQDTDRIVIDDLVINNIGIGVQLHGADAPSIRNSWIAETTTSIILNGASQQASIVNNSLGAQPDGVTIELENAKWFNISGNNIYPDGSSNIRLYNPIHGTIASNTISARYNG